MVKEFKSLSEKINSHQCDHSWHEWISPRDVRESIRRVKADDFDSEEKVIKEVTSMVIANLSLTRPISIDDIRYAIQEGFKKSQGYMKRKADKEFGEELVKK